MTPLLKPECEGDPSGWHIRLDNRVVVNAGLPEELVVESWSLFYGDRRESSPTIKRFAEQWRDQELAEENK